MIDHVAILTHHHFGGRPGDPAYGGRVALQAVRVHAVRREEPSAAEPHAVEDVIAGIAVAQDQFAFQRDHGALRPGANILPLAVPLPVGLRVSPCAVVAQAPGAIVQPALQVEVIAVVFAAPVARKAVVQQRGGNAFIPLFRRNVAPGAVLQCHLRQANVQAL